VINRLAYKEAILIRRIEETFLELYSEGSLNGTVHTCIGQEFSAVAFAGALQEKYDDFIFSNHRCHGHYISFTKDVEGLIAELLGKASGTCGGVGSSQHLHKTNFFSNGVQGGIIPVAAGLALANKLKMSNAIGIVFIGDGTLGEGVVYESLNMISKWTLPLLVVLENNCYAQTTAQNDTLAGEIAARAEAFGLPTKRSDTWHLQELFDEASLSIDEVRRTRAPVFHIVDTYRLAPHSKGDDYREAEEVAHYRSIDPIVQLEVEDPALYSEFYDSANEIISNILDAKRTDRELTIAEYMPKQEVQSVVDWQPIEAIHERQVELLNNFFFECLGSDDRTILLGEDIESPYGGAFKVYRDLSDVYPGQVITTPISELGISGVANGLALAGMRPYVEFMFGDFVTLGFDQLVNHAAKFYHMYNKQISCPVVFRTPMGGGRGYGPTHSQTLDKHLLGIDNIRVVALNTFVDPRELYGRVHEEEHPVVVIENKLDYGRRIGVDRKAGFKYLSSGETYPIVRISPNRSMPDVTIVTYGGIANVVNECIEELFMNNELKAEVFILSQIHPLDIKEIADSLYNTGYLFTVEEGSLAGGVGAEIVATLSETVATPFVAHRIGGLEVPVPSARGLENQVIPSSDRILKTIVSVVG
jgi:2-oxoisovalerate dehydrogenase E1 component